MFDTSTAINAYNKAATDAVTVKRDFSKSDTKQDALLREQTDAFGKSGFGRGYKKRKFFIWKRCRGRYLSIYV